MLRQAWNDIKEHYTDLADVEEPTDEELAAVADEIAALTILSLNEQALIDRIVAETLTEADATRLRCAESGVAYVPDPVKWDDDEPF